MLSEHDNETVDKLNSLRTQIELLDSHRTVGLITNKQYAESLETIVNKVETIENEYGLEPYYMSANNILHGNQADNFNNSIKDFEDNWFNKEVHKAIDEVANEI